MGCRDCGYWYKAKENDAFPCCQFEGPVGWAPCEAEDDDIYLDEGEE